MSFYSNKDKMEYNDYKNICRNHSAKTDRENFRVCPSKLSKRELEDLYFTLLENNLELKKTINGQQDKIRVLSTQVQRMANTQERLVSKEMKDRGTVTKAVVDEQKDFISELKETNQRLTDRIQQLNMRLCSAKQFMKTSPPQPAPFRGNRSAATAVSTPKKHDCLKSPEKSPEQVIKVSTFSQWEEKTPRKTNQIQNNVAVEKRPLKSDQPCDENKCRTLMEELKQKIATLQDELLNVHGEYATRIGRLETEVIEVRKENIRVISERSASELDLTESCKRLNALLAQYRSYEAKCSELNTELAIEKRKVAELETQLKAAKMSDKVNKTIEDHILTTKQETSGTPDGGPRKVARRVVTPRGGGLQDVSSPDRKRDAAPPSGKLQDGDPPDGKPLNNGAPDAGLRYGKPQNAGQPDGGLRDGKPLNAGPPDGGLRDGKPQNTGPSEAGLRDGKPLNTGSPDGGLRDGKPLYTGPPHAGLRDGKPLNAGPPDDNLRDDGPQSGSSQDDIPQKCDCGCSHTPLNPPPPVSVVDEKAPIKDVSPRKCNCGCPPPTSPSPPPAPGRVVDEKAPIKDGSPRKCNCGCLPPASPTRPPTPGRVVDEKAPIKTVPPILPTKKRDGLDDTSSKSFPTKYSSTKSCSTASKYSSSYRSCTTTTSGDTNCENCGCKLQLMSDVPSPIYPVQAAQYPMAGAIVDGKCIMCGHAPPPPPPPAPPSPPLPKPAPLPPPPENTSTPIKDKKNNVECRCPPWVQDVRLSPSQETNPKCLKCCFKDQLESEFPPPKTIEGLAPSAGVSSLGGDPNSTSSNTVDDSGYQDTEQALIKQNKELMAMVLELQRQVDCLKIGGFCGMPECPSESLNELERSPMKTEDNPAVTTAPPLVEILKPSEVPEDKPDKLNSPVRKDMASTRPHLLGEPPQAEIPVEQTEQLPKGDNNEPIISIASDNNLYLPKKALRIEPLGNPEETTAPVQRRTSDDTRAKTVEDLDGTQYIADEVLKVPDKYGYPDIPNNEYRDSKGSPKFKIVEKKKIEGSALSILSRTPGSKNPSLKSVTLGPGFNPEKYKYLEAEGLTTDTPRESLTESIPSNPELGFGIPRFTSKPDQIRNDSLSTNNPTVPKPGDPVVPKAFGRRTLPASRSNTPEQTDGTLKDKEDCQYCAACSFDKECVHTIQPMNKLALGMQKEHDQHNSLQIPGPIPSLDTGKKDKKGIISQFRKHKRENQSAEDLIVNSKIYAKQTCQTVGGPVTLPDVPLLEKREESIKDSEIDQKTLTHNKKDKSWKRRKANQTKDDLIVNPRIFAQNTCETAGGPVTLRDVPLLEKAVQEGSMYGPEKDSDEGNADTKQKCTEKSSQAPGYKAWQGDMSLYRRRSGTSCFRRGQQTDGSLVCRCVGQPDGACPHEPRNKGIQVVDNPENMSPRERRRVLMSDRGTYTLESKPTATSPDNTDLEMSYLSDLPMEKEKKSPLKSRPLSPGEDKTTTSTSTSYGTSPPTDYSLSEGEMPAPATKRRLSVSDREEGIFVNPTLKHKVETPPAQQMEAALQAITDELQRCKYLLHRHRPEQHATHSTKEASCSAKTSATTLSRPIALKAAPAQQGIGDTQPPTAVFTLHVGTVVLSDEAVLYSRDKSLVLKWKFYDQAMTMARMRAQRVMLFDFSTEYDVEVTEAFLNYLKHEKMPIIICELGHEEQPFACCVLPLRDALLHTNTRVDMSIALVAGAQMLKARTTNAVDPLDNSDEIGVIDLWCMLYSESTLMVPGINLAIGQPGALMKMEKRQSDVKLQGGDDSNELELSSLRSGPAATHEQTGKNLSYADVGYARPSATWSYQPRVRPSAGSQPGSAGPAKEATYDPSKYPPLRERKSSFASTGKPAKPDEVYSDVIFNEVKPMIKTPGDVKYAMQKTNLQYDSKYRYASPNEQELDSTNYQANNSYSSLRSVLSRLHKKGGPQTQTHGGDQRYFIEKLRKAGRPGAMVRTEAKDLEIYKKYENMSKFSGSTRTDQSKKVTIHPEYFESEVEKPQRDIVEEPTVQDNQKRSPPKLEITVLWLALNEKCDAMKDPRVQRVYVAYNFLGRSGADLETPVSLPKPRHYVDKCYFNFTKVFELEDADFPKLGHMARCRNNNDIANERDCIIFCVVSEPPEDPLGIESCEDIGYAYLYLGDLLAYSAGSPGYTEVMPVRAARGAAAVCGVLAVRVDGLDVVRRCLHLTSS